jgi:hypothetical protein
MYILVVTSGDFAGRYIGLNIAGLRKVLDNHVPLEIPIAGTGFSLFRDEVGAYHLTELSALTLQAALLKFGLTTELR